MKWKGYLVFEWLSPVNKGLQKDRSTNPTRSGSRPSGRYEKKVTRGRFPGLVCEDAPQQRRILYELRLLSIREGERECECHVIECVRLRAPALASVRREVASS